MNTFDQAMETFFSQYKLRDYARNDLILHQDDTPNGVYLIKTGLVKTYSFSPDGRELIRNILGPGDFFPIRWTFSHEPIDFYLAPLTDITCWYAPRQDFVEFLNSNSGLLLELTAYITRRMNGLYKRMELFAFGDAYQRVTGILIFLVKKYGKYEENKHIRIELPITQKEIGNLIGTSRETVNEELDKLREMDLIETRDRQIIIKDLAKLDDEAILIDASEIIV